VCRATYSGIDAPSAVRSFTHIGAPLTSDA
jgi:hypothetical protein